VRIVPSGYSSLSDAVRAGIKLERAGAGAENVHKQIGLAHQTYRSARDIVLLSERDDLSIRDADTVRRALRQFDETRRIKDSAESIKPIALKVWGRKGHRYKSDKKRLEAFLNSISFVVTICTAIAEIEIPNLDKQRGSEVTVQLQEAIAALNVLLARIL